MRNFIYAIGVCSLLFSCNSELETLPEEFNTEGTAPLVTRVAAHPKYGVLGWGYDVTGNYMSHGKGVTLPVIDIDRFEAENFDRIVLDSSTSQETEYYYGTTAEEYLKRVGDNVDTGVDAKKALFSLTITGNYQKNTSYSSEYSFAGCDHYYSLKRCYIRAAVERLQNYLSDTFREDLAELPAEDIIIPDEYKRISFSPGMPEVLNNYLTAANYTDYAIGKFIERLQEEGLFDETMIVVTGDHEGLAYLRQSLCETKEGGGLVSPFEYTPFIVINSPVGMRYEKVMGQVDIYSTLLDLTGLDDYGWKGMGQSILDPSHLGVAAIWNLTIAGDTTGICPEAIERMKQSWRISDLMIRGDYFRSDF